MQGMRHHPGIALLSLVVLIAGCSSSVDSLAPGPSAPQSPEAFPSAIPTAIPSLPTTPKPEPPSPPPSQTASSSLTVDTVAVTVADGLRVRSQPRVSEDSYKYEPLLPIGTPLYVLGGPISASGYNWYEVAPLSSRSLQHGWVASADRDGEPWLETGDFDCPRLPTDLRSLASLPPGVGLACFPRMPITVEARIVQCNCDVDGGWYSPSWFLDLSGGPKLLVEPEVDRPPDDPDDWLVLNLDPEGQHPDVLPIGSYLGGTSWSKPGVVEVTGIFDHPAAAGCTLTEPDGEPVPSQDCRLAFAATQVTVRP